MSCHDIRHDRITPRCATYHPGVVHQLKVRLVFAFLVGPRPLEVGGLPQVVVIQFGLEALVRGFGEHTLLLQDGQDAQRLERPERDRGERYRERPRRETERENGERDTKREQGERHRERHRGRPGETDTERERGERDRHQTTYTLCLHEGTNRMVRSRL